MISECPLVSIIMPAYNAERFIEESITSVIAQTYGKWELIVIDDGSSDSTKTIVENIAKSHRNIFLIDNIKKPKGAASARNSGLEFAKGNYIAFLDSDDVWLPEKLSSQITLMKESKCFASHSSYFRIDQYGKNINTVMCKRYVEYKDQLRSNYIPNLTGIYDREFVGLVYQNHIGHEDYDMWLNILNKVPSRGVSMPLAKYRVLDQSLSSNKFSAALWHYKILSNQKGVGFFYRMYLFNSYLFYAILKRFKL
ncbi:glycosyltransferase family 2 protein [Vibrio splendidus]|uniref:glycosyltransferase family 2 protein n=1 Tax=Vibrio splendidus TaxID=29497 RepID=UPI00352E5A1B